MQKTEQKTPEFKIGVFLRSMSGSFFGRVVKDLMQTAKDNGILLVFFVGDSGEEAVETDSKNSVFRLAENASLDALIILTDLVHSFQFQSEAARSLLKENFPGLNDVPVYSIFSPLEGAFCAVIDENEAVTTMMRHLINKHGYKKFAMLCGTDFCMGCNSRRFSIISRELESAGLSLPPKMIFRGGLAEKTGKTVALDLLVREKEDFPDVIISMNEEVGIAAQELLASRGIFVPDDVAFVGFNDSIELVSDHLPRSTVDYPVWEMVSFVMNRIISDLSGKTKFSPSEQVFKAAFIIRNSCGCTNAQIPSSEEMEDDETSVSTITGNNKNKDRFFSGELKQVAAFKKTLNLIAEECLGKADVSEIGSFMKKTVSMLKEGGGISSDFIDAFSTQWIITLLKHPIPQEQMLINSAFIDANRLLFKTQLDVSLEIKKADKGLLDFYQCCNEIMAKKETVTNGLKEIGLLLPSLGVSFMYIFLNREENSPEVDYRLGFKKNKMIFVPEKDFSVFDASSKTGSFLNNPEFLTNETKSLAVYSISQSNVNYGYLLLSVDEKYFKNFAEIRHIISHMIESLMMHEYTERQLLALQLKNSELSKLSFVDEFTQLGNRRALLTKGKEIFNSAMEKKDSICMIFLDMDKLKYINDTFGHAEGDQAILSFAEILKKCFRSTDLLIRYGGDEFVGIVTGLQKSAHQEIFRRISNHIDKFNQEKQKQWILAACWGFEYFDPRENGIPPTFEEMLRASDEKLYAEKRRKKALQSPDGSR